MAKKPPPTPKPRLPKPPKIRPKKRNPHPGNYLRGSHLEGEKYTAYDNYNQGRPDFGKGAGPGEPYHEVQRTVQPPIPGPKKGRQAPGWAPGRGVLNPKPTQPRTAGNPGGGKSLWQNAQRLAIRKRLETY